MPENRKLKYKYPIKCTLFYFYLYLFYGLINSNNRIWTRKTNVRNYTKNSFTVI